MSTYYTKPEYYVPIYGTVYKCDADLYSECTLYEYLGLGLCVIQQRFDPVSKTLKWGPVEPWIANDIYTCDGFEEFLKAFAGRKDERGLYPTFKLRPLMKRLRMRPLKKEFWED